MVSLSSLVMASSVSCLDVSDSLALSTPGVLTSNVTSVTAALAHTQVCSSPAVPETHLFCMDQLSTTSSLPVTHAACSLPTTTQLGTPQRRVIILPSRGNISPIKVSTSPKHILSPHVSTSVVGGALPITATYTNCGLADQKCTGAVRTANESYSVCISSCNSQCVGSVLQSSESNDRTLSTTLHVDGILTSNSENASRHGIISVACRESRVQETAVLSSVTSVARQSVLACNDDHSVSSSKNVTVPLTSGHMYQSGKSVSQVSGDKIPGTQVRPVNCEASVHQAVALAHSGIAGQQTVTSSTRTVSVTSIRKICPSVDTQKRNVIVKLFAENSGSLNVRTAEQCQPANVTSAGSSNSPKRIVLLTSTATENTSSDCCPSVLQRSSNTAESVNAPTVCQPCRSLQTINLVVTSTANVVSTVSSCASQKVSEALTFTLNSSQNSPVLVVDSSRLSTMPTESSSNCGMKSDDDSDDDSVVIIDADIVPSSPSPCCNNTKRSVTAQNVILLNRHKTSSQSAVDTERSAPKTVVMDRTEQSRTKRKSALGTRLLESASDEGIILPASKVFENGSRISQPSRRKSFPQRRTDTSVPQLQFCTKQWKRDINSSQSTTASPTCKRSQSRSPKKDTGTDLLSKADGSTRSELPLSSQSNLQCSQNSSDKRKRKPVDQYELSTLPEVKRSKRLLPAKTGDAYCNKNVETADKIVHKEAAVESGITATSLAAHLTETSDSIPITVSSHTSYSSSATNTNCCGNVKTTEPVSDLSELQLLGKDKRSMEMSVTNEDGVVENLLVTIIDISSSEEEEDEVEVQSVSTAKLDPSEVLMPEIETSQSVASKSLIISSSEKPLQDKSCGNSSTLSSDRQSVSKSLCKPNRVRQKCRQTIRSSMMGRKVLVGHGRLPSSEDRMDSTKVKQLTQLHGKSTNRKRSKNDASGTVKADSDSISAGHWGPVVRLHGSRDSRASCSIVSGARDADDETSARLKQKSVVLNASCYPTSFQLQDSVTWKCVFCQQGSSFRTLGDLFGPYYAKSDSSAKSDGVLCQSSPSKSRRHSAKKSPESGYTVVSKNSQRRRQQLQKYVPSRRSPQKSSSSPDKGIPSEIWMHEDCAVWTSGICLSPTGQLCGLEAAVTLSLQTVCSLCRMSGATLGCFIKGCSLCYHYLCAADAGCSLELENFKVFCAKHKNKRMKSVPVQSSPS